MSEMFDQYPFALHFGLYPKDQPGYPNASYAGHSDAATEVNLTGILLSPFTECPTFVSGSWGCWGPDDQDSDGDQSLHVTVYLATMDAATLDLARAAVLDHVNAGDMLTWGTVTTSADWSLTLGHWIWDAGMRRFQIVHGTVEYSDLDHRVAQ